MAKFKIVASRPTTGEMIADFDVVFLQGALRADDEFVVYETHHKVTCKIIEAQSSGEIVTLRCRIQMPLGWQDHWAASIVDTQATTRPAAFRYVHDESDE